ncbi:microsomal triacylglycerol transfer protein [Plodia interpunctella]|uniref:microsomal triacylglycerol transfer protein n=1 Tax=Plodia interpunctella TaxID=58824 RepID=UPI002368C509|nr:microsomal triacylglycerol transfer protein [Plodia interpunctella]
MFFVNIFILQSLVGLLLCLIFTLPRFLVSASTVPLEYGEFKLFQTPVTYDLNTSVSINDENEGGRTIGYRITALVGVEPIWSDQKTDFLLKFHLESPLLSLTGPAGSAAAQPPWPGPQTPFYARLTHGMVQAAYLDERDPLDLLNYKKSIVSLFQFRAIDGENKETDVSGLCDVVYQSASFTTIHKIKTRCSEDEGEDEQWSRRASYSLSRTLAALAGVSARERVRVGGARAALGARAEHALSLRARAPERERALAADLERALAALPAHLKPLPLTLHEEPEQWEREWEWEEELEPALAELVSLEGGGGEEAGAGGEERDARALLRALSALAAAERGAVLRLLEHQRYHPVLPVLYRLVGQSGSGAALAAAVARLQAAAADPPRALALQLLAGAARAHRPDAAARGALLALARAARAPLVADAALLAAAAQARRQPDDARHVKDLITKQLSKCEEESCYVVRLHALANLAARSGADTALQFAAGGARAAALAALDTLHAIDSLEPRHIAALQEIAVRGGRALEVRASALELVVLRAPAAALPALAAELRRAPSELRRVFWQLAERRAAGCDDARRQLRAASLLDRSWHARANSGMSSVLSRATGWRLDAGAAELRSTQLAAAGALRRGTVALVSQPRGEELLAVEVWTRGLESLAGGAGGAGGAGLDEEEAGGEEAGGEEAGARGGLRLRVAGVHQPGLLLFDGQAELLGHIWSGAGSAATAVLRGERVRGRGGRGRAAALATGAVLRVRALSVLAFAVDAQAQVSLWSRSARAALELRAAEVADTRLALRAPGGGRLWLAADAGAAPRLTLDAHMDFYDGVALCVRAALPAHSAAGNVTAAGGRTRLRRRHSLPAPGRTLSLGADNDRACRHIAAEDHP